MCGSECVYVCVCVRVRVCVCVCASLPTCVFVFAKYVHDSVGYLGLNVSVI